MVTMAQSAANWRNTHTHMDRMYSLTHFTSAQLQPRGAKRHLSSDKCLLRVRNNNKLAKTTDREEEDKTKTER